MNCWTTESVLMPHKTRVDALADWFSALTAYARVCARVGEGRGRGMADERWCVRCLGAVCWSKCVFWCALVVCVREEGRVRWCACVRACAACEGVKDDVSWIQ